MKTKTTFLRWAVTLTLLSPALTGRAQVAQWTFDNLLSGIPGLNVLTDPASLGSSIPTGAYNGGTVFYGEGGWPSGPLDPNAYLQFTVKPVLAYSLTISSMQLNIRRSTTGSSAGPNNWSLRSSLDNYTTDISNGVLSTSSTPAIPVTFGASFAHLSAPVTFRLYGYNMTITAGGLNRFVFDQITIGGATVLPVVFGTLTATPAGKTVNLAWSVPAQDNLKEMQVQRALNKDSFRTIATMAAGQTSYQYNDAGIDTDGIYTYRIAIVSKDNVRTYSAGVPVKIATQTGLTMQGIAAAPGLVRLRISVSENSDYAFTLYDMNGNEKGVSSAHLVAGVQTITLGTNPGKGIYLVRAQSGGRTVVTRVMVP